VLCGHSSSLSQSHLKEISTPMNLIQEVTTNIEEELKNDNTSLFLHKIYLHMHTHTHTHTHTHSYFIIYLFYLFTGSVSNVINNTTVLLKALVFVKQQNQQIIQQNEEILKILRNNKERPQGPNFQEPNLPVQLSLKNFEEVTLLHDHISDNENFSELVCFSNVFKI